MSAVLQLVKQTGGSIGNPANEDVVTTLKLGTKDMLDPLQVNQAEYWPVALPSSDFNYPFYVHLALLMTSTFTDIRNIRAWISTSPSWPLGTGGDKLYGKRASAPHGAPPANYNPASGVVGDTGHALDDVTNGHPYYNSGGNGVGSWDEIDTEGEIIQIDDSFYSDSPSPTSYAMLLQYKVDTLANGALAQPITGGQVTFRAQVVN